jgi:hypothetical protein
MILSGGRSNFYIVLSEHQLMEARRHAVRTARAITRR